MELINKAALIAEIERREGLLDLDNPLGRGGMVELERLRYVINTLEVKEVDLEEEIEKECEKVHQLAAGKELRVFAKHFFELGLKVQKGE